MFGRSAIILKTGTHLLWRLSTITCRISSWRRLKRHNSNATLQWFRTWCIVCRSFHSLHWAERLVSFLYRARFALCGRVSWVALRANFMQSDIGSNQKLEEGNHIWTVLVPFWHKTFWQQWHDHVMDLCSDFTIVSCTNYPLVNIYITVAHSSMPHSDQLYFYDVHWLVISLSSRCVDKQTFVP